jgi:hypothetical protein
MSGLTSAATSINENKDSGILGGFDHILELSVSRNRLFELGGKPAVERLQTSSSNGCFSPALSLYSFTGTPHR